MINYRLVETSDRPSNDHAFVCLSQERDVLDEIAAMIGNRDITQAWFITEHGDYDDLYVGFNSPSFGTPSKFYRVESEFLNSKLSRLMFSEDSFLSYNAGNCFAVIYAQNGTFRVVFSFPMSLKACFPNKLGFTALTQGDLSSILSDFDMTLNDFRLVEE